MRLNLGSKYNGTRHWIKEPLPTTLEGFLRASLTRALASALVHHGSIISEWGLSQEEWEALGDKKNFLREHIPEEVLNR